LGTSITSNCHTSQITEKKKKTKQKKKEEKFMKRRKLIIRLFEAGCKDSWADGRVCCAAMRNANKKGML